LIGGHALATLEHLLETVDQRDRTADEIDRQ
jgi:hypothetical protein